VFHEGMLKAIRSLSPYTPVAEMNGKQLEHEYLNFVTR